jgi:glycosyltransferase involved in cell wall biosynthesis
MSSINNRQLLCDFWYFRELDDIAVPFERYAEEKIGPRFARFLLRFSVLRALLLIWLGRDFPLIAPDWFRYGRLICVLQAILRNRNIVIFECIDIAVWKKGPIIAAAILFIYNYVIGPGMRASVVAVQVQTDRERQIFVERFGLPEDMLHTVRWPLSGMDYAVKATESSLWQQQLDTTPIDWDSEVRNPIGATRTRYVLASGYNSCDWKTLFEAAQFGNWPLIVACANAKDLPLLTALNKNGRAKVLTKVNAADHNRLVAGATIYALCLKETMKSNGQGRLAEAIAAGVPVVASNVLGLEGSLIDGVTAIAVEVGNPAALARAIENLMNEPERRNALAVAAKRYAAKFTKDYYFSELRQLLSRCFDNRR